MSKSLPTVDYAKHLETRRYQLAESRFWKAVQESMAAIKRAHANDPHGDDPIAFAEFLGWQAYGQAAIDHMHTPRCHRR